MRLTRPASSLYGNATVPAVSTAAGTVTVMPRSRLKPVMVMVPPLAAMRQQDRIGWLLLVLIAGAMVRKAWLRSAWVVMSFIERLG
jgi:hypothetical protein